MPQVKTRVGTLEVPDLAEVGPQTKYWAEALFDLAKIEEVYGVLELALRETAACAAQDAFFEMLGGIGELAKDLERNPAWSGEAAGPLASNPDGVDAGTRPTEPAAEASNVSRCYTESF